MVLTDDRIVIALGKADDFVHAGRASLLTAHGRNWTSGRAARLDFFDPSGAGMLPIFGDGRLIGFGPDQTRPADPDAVLARIEVVLHAARELWESQAADDDQAEPTPIHRDRWSPTSSPTSTRWRSAWPTRAACCQASTCPATTAVGSTISCTAWATNTTEPLSRLASTGMPLAVMPVCP